MFLSKADKFTIDINVVQNYDFFLFREEDEGEDEVDSDFSIDENDEPVSDPEQEGPKKKRRLVTKAYKEPKPVAAQPKTITKEKKPRIIKRRKFLNDSTGQYLFYFLKYNTCHQRLVHSKNFPSFLSIAVFYSIVQK